MLQEEMCKKVNFYAETAILGLEKGGKPEKYGDAKRNSIGCNF